MPSPALIGLPLLFGSSHSYGTTFQAGLGFAGIAVALLGRNNPIGIAFGALLFAFLTEQSNLLEINAGVSNDIVAITQGVIVLTVVIAYEVVRRYAQAQEQRSRGRAAGAQRRDARRRGMTHRHEPRAATSPAASATGPRRIPVWVWLLVAFVLISSPGCSPVPTSSTPPAPCARRSPRPSRSPWPAWRVCGPSAPVWSTSASRA